MVNLDGRPAFHLEPEIKRDLRPAFHLEPEFILDVSPAIHLNILPAGFRILGRMALY
jgi:hypothetical protein